MIGLWSTSFIGSLLSLPTALARGFITLPISYCNSFPTSFPAWSFSLPSTPQFILQLPSRTILLKSGSDRAAALIKNLKSFPEPTDKIQTTEHSVQSTIQWEPHLSALPPATAQNNDNQSICGSPRSPSLLWTLVLFLGGPLHSQHQGRVSHALPQIPRARWEALPDFLAARLFHHKEESLFLNSVWFVTCWYF